MIIDKYRLLVVKNNQKNNEGHYINLLKEFIKI